MPGPLVGFSSSRQAERLLGLEQDTSVHIIAELARELQEGKRWRLVIFLNAESSADELSGAVEHRVALYQVCSRRILQESIWVHFQSERSKYWNFMGTV